MFESKKLSDTKQAGSDNATNRKPKSEQQAGAYVCIWLVIRRAEKTRRGETRIFTKIPAAFFLKKLILIFIYDKIGLSNERFLKI